MVALELSARGSGNVRERSQVCARSSSLTGSVLVWFRLRSQTRDRSPCVSRQSMEHRRISIILSASVHLQNTAAILVIGGARILRNRAAPFLERFKFQSIGDVCSRLRRNCNYESAKH